MHVVDLILEEEKEHELRGGANFALEMSSMLCNLPNDDENGTLSGSNSVVEKDLGLSRTSDSDAELLPQPAVLEFSESSGNPPCTKICNPSGHKMKRSLSDASLERELASLHHEMQTIRLECDRLILQHNNAERRVAQQVAQASSLMNTIGELSSQSVQPKHSQKHQILSQYGLEDTSSAYNTGGESCRSTPLKCDHCHHVDKRPFVDGKFTSSGEAVFHQVEHNDHCAATVQTASVHSQTKPRLSQCSVVPCDSSSGMKQTSVSFSRCWDSPIGSYRPGDTMYTSADKLAATIALQQRLLRQAVMEQADIFKPNPAYPRRSNKSCEWKIKRRSDGTRYITRKLTRNRMLREREEQLNKERTGISTDDDAMSELKTGRFWNREERKKHLESARERKLRHYQILSEKSGFPSDQKIMQLSHKKMMRRRSQQLFDKFTTIQEFLAYGNRELSTRPNDGILSVTTV
ncbi:hypothetical protein AB6A40_003719 [Gnathostoma spinigerum]|uniref:Uncharacterized protein n=1 Tax=Gnathostoma spinigerum TaxID=75299 RepID=A0ABD6EL62_9BILA